MQKIDSRAALRRLPRVRHLAPASGDIFDAASRTGRLMRSHDWSATALGPVRQWPENLKAALRLMLTSPAPMLIWWGEDLIGLYNDACAEMFGRRLESRVIGRPAAEVRHELWSTLVHDVADVMSENRPAVQRERPLVVRRTSRPKERYFTFSFTPIRNDWGHASGVLATCTDDTALVLNRRRLAVLHSLTSPSAQGPSLQAPSLQNVAQTAVQTLAANRHDIPFALIYLLENEHMRLAASAGALPKTLEHGGDPLDRPSESEAIPEVAAWPLPLEAEGGARVVPLPPQFAGCTSGVWPEAPAGAVVLPIPSVGGPETRGPRAVLVLGVSPRLAFDDAYRNFFDLTATTIGGMLSRAAEQGEAARRQLTADERNNEFLAMLAHELRNPLAPIRSAAELLKFVDRKPGSLPHAREIIERQLTQLVRLMDDLLDASRISRGKLELRKQPFDVRDAAVSAVESATPAMQEAGHELTVGLSREPLTVSGDRARLIQVIGNLLTNAAQYTPRGGHIRLSIGRDGADAVVSVTDDGMGIKEDMLPRIFEMFTQVAPREDGPRKGLGIGLTIARRLVEMHGGSLTACSAGPDFGSEFIATLPLIEAPDAGSTAEVPHEPKPDAVGLRDGRAAGGVGNRRILVADDNTDAALAIAEVLRTMGHEVRTADDGQAAVEAAVSFRPDMILLDLGMPRLDGYEACRRIRGMPWGRDVLIYAVTGWGQASDRRRTREAGFNAHLVKPVEIGAIEKLIERGAPL